MRQYADERLDCWRLLFSMVRPGRMSNATQFYWNAGKLMATNSSTTSTRACPNYELANSLENSWNTCRIAISLFAWFFSPVKRRRFIVRSKKIKIVAWLNWPTFVQQEIGHSDSVDYENLRIFRLGNVMFSYYSQWATFSRLRTGSLQVIKSSLAPRLECRSSGASGWITQDRIKVFWSFQQDNHDEIKLRIEIFPKINFDFFQDL